MIEAAVIRRDGRVCAFTIKNHGRTDVCAAVSVLVINTINSIEALTEESFAYDYNEKGGFVYFKAEGIPGKEASLLLDAMMLGLQSVKEQYGKQIRITVSDG